MNQHAGTPLVSETLEDGVLTLTLGGGKAHALSLGMIGDLHTAIRNAGQDAETRVIVIYGPGSIYCAGHDLKEIAHHRADNDLGEAYLRQLFDACGAMMQDITLSPKPTIAMVEGIATAGGLQLVSACDLAFATTQATFCLPGVVNGGFCTTPAVAVGRNLARKHVMEMALSGARYDAEWALSAGLINRIATPDDLVPQTMEFAKTLASRNANAVASGKQTLYRQLEMPMAQAYATATEVMISHFMDPDRIAHERQTWGKT